MNSNEHLDDKQVEDLSRGELLIVAKLCASRMQHFQSAFVAAKTQLSEIAVLLNDTNNKMRAIINRLDKEDISGVTKPDNQARKAGNHPDHPKKKGSNTKSKNNKKDKKVVNGTELEIRNPVNGVYGTATGDIPFRALPPPEPMSKLILKRIVKKSLTKDGLKDYLRLKLNVEAKYIYEYSRDDSEAVSFSFLVRSEDAEKCKQGSLWPVGAVCKDFVKFADMSKNRGKKRQTGA